MTPDEKGKYGLCNAFLMEIEQMPISGSCGDVLRVRCKRCGHMYEITQSLFGEWNIEAKGKAPLTIE